MGNDNSQPKGASIYPIIEMVQAIVETTPSYLNCLNLARVCSKGVFVFRACDSAYSRRTSFHRDHVVFVPSIRRDCKSLANGVVRRRTAMLLRSRYGAEYRCHREKFVFRKDSCYLCTAIVPSSSKRHRLIVTYSSMLRSQQYTATCERGAHGLRGSGERNY